MARSKTDTEQAAKGAYLSSRKQRKRVSELEPVILKSPYWAAMYAWASVKGRWKEAERVIAKDGDASLVYAINALQGPFPLGEKMVAKKPLHALEYARHVLKSRFRAGEKAIAKHAEAACNYAAHVIRGRWRPGEAAMKEDPYVLLTYAQRVFKGPLPRELHEIMLARSSRNASARKYVTNRKYMGSAVRKKAYTEPRGDFSDEYKAWRRDCHAALTAYRTAKKAGRRMPDLEQTVLKDPEATYKYARDVIKGRWAQGERVLATSATWACLYAMNVVHGRFPAAEEAIAAHDRAALSYAAKAIKARFPACEKRFAKDPFWAVEYAVHVIRGRWEPAEKLLGEANAKIAYTYAKKVLQGPLPGKVHEIMMAIRPADRTGFAERYAVEFGDSAAAMKPRKKAAKRAKPRSR